MCKYCDPNYKTKNRNDTNLIEDQSKESNMEMFLTQSIDEDDYWFLTIHHYSAEDDEYHSLPIRNCPMCGRLLQCTKPKTYEEILTREG